MKSKSNSSLQMAARGLLAMCIAAVAAVTSSYAQRIAIITPEPSQMTETYRNAVAAELSGSFTVIDGSLADTAFRALSIETPFNMTLAESRRAASAAGCDLILLVQAGGTRRMSFEKDDYYEFYAIGYLVSGRTGQLVDWTLNSLSAPSREKAEAAALADVPRYAEFLTQKIAAVRAAERSEEPPPEIEEVPEVGSKAAAGLHPPMPYRRIKPEYTSTAFLYNARATVDIEVDIGTDGSILRTRIIRWAGFGLDESVIEAVRKMNWRHADRNGTPLPMRVLLRYNFTKTE